jgi:hypothetical protein
MMLPEAFRHFGVMFKSLYLTLSQLYGGHLQCMLVPKAGMIDFVDRVSVRIAIHRLHSFAISFSGGDRDCLGLIRRF